MKKCNTCDKELMESFFTEQSSDDCIFCADDKITLSKAKKQRYKEIEESFSKAIAYMIVAVPIVAIMILVVYIFGFVAVPENKTTYDFVKDHGSLIAGLIAFLAAAIALYSQRKSTQRQIDAQRALEQDRLITSKIEELFEVVEGLRVKVLLTRPHLVKDITLDIDVLYHDVSKATMLCMLYDIADRELFIEYRQSVEDHLANWSDISFKMLSGIELTEHDTKKFKSSSHMFFEHSKALVNSLAIDQ